MTPNGLTCACKTRATYLAAALMSHATAICVALEDLSDSIPIIPVIPLITMNKC